MFLKNDEGVFEIDNETVFPMRITSKQNSPHHVDLL